MDRGDHQLYNQVKSSLHDTNAFTSLIDSKFAAETPHGLTLTQLRFF